MTRQRRALAALLLVLLAGAAWANPIPYDGPHGLGAFAASALMAEAIAVVIEALAMAMWAGWTWPQAVRGSLLMNLASFALGTAASHAVGARLQHPPLWLIPLVAFLIAEGVEVIIAAELSHRWKVRPERAMLVCAVAHCFSWPMVVWIFTGLNAWL